jgi:hypothetical protein
LQRSYEWLPIDSPPVSQDGRLLFTQQGLDSAQGHDVILL